MMINDIILSEIESQQLRFYEQIATILIVFVLILKKTNVFLSAEVSSPRTFARSMFSNKIRFLA